MAVTALSLRDLREKQPGLLALRLPYQLYKAVRLYISVVFHFCLPETSQYYIWSMLFHLPSKQVEQPSILDTKQHSIQDVSYIREERGKQNANVSEKDLPFQERKRNYFNKNKISI